MSVDESPALAPAPRMPEFGEFAPLFIVASDQNPRFRFASLGGTWMVLAFFGSLGPELSREAFDTVLARRSLFDDVRAQFFGVSIDPADRSTRGLKNSLPGLRFFWDFDRQVSRLYGIARPQHYVPTAFLLDPFLRVVASAPLREIESLLDRLEVEASQAEAAEDQAFAPVLTVPRIFEPELCKALIAHYELIGGQRSGFMTEIDGMTVGQMDDARKRRRDVHIADEALREATRTRITHRLIPAVQRAFGWRATRIERFIISCYDAEEAGFFRTHRDNTTPGTAHRKFAVTLNLNTEDYEGGELRFPEFGRRTYKPPTGGATVFACGLLHEARPVSKGIRYAFLPFLYDEEGKRLRTENEGTIVNPPQEAAAPAQEAVGQPSTVELSV